MTPAAELIRDPRELRPETAWSETVWGWAAEEALVDHAARPRLCVAALLPFAEGAPDWDGFLHSIRWMQAGAAHFGIEIVFVLNADTGYIFQLDAPLYAEVLRRFREAFPAQRFIAGVTARGAENDTAFRADRYRPLLDLAQEHENCEVMLMTSRRLAELGPERRLEAYLAIGESLIRPALVHALEPAFVPWARPFEPWLLYRLAQHPGFIGGKVSTLTEPHFLYWSAMCRDCRLDFVPHSGDDFGLATAIRLGLPLLVGAGASAAPLLCAAWPCGARRRAIRACTSFSRPFSHLRTPFSAWTSAAAPPLTSTPPPTCSTSLASLPRRRSTLSAPTAAPPAKTPGCGKPWSVRCGWPASWAFRVSRCLPGGFSRKPRKQETKKKKRRTENTEVFVCSFCIPPSWLLAFMASCSCLSFR